MQVEAYQDYKDVEYWESCLDRRGKFEISGFANNDKAVTTGRLVGVEEKIEHYDLADSIDFYKSVSIKIESRELGGTVTYDVPASNVKKVTWH